MRELEVQQEDSKLTSILVLEELLRSRCVALRLIHKHNNNFTIKFQPSRYLFSTLHQFRFHSIKGKTPTILKNQKFRAFIYFYLFIVML